MRMVCLLLLTWGTAWAEEPSPSPAPTDVRASHQYYDLGAQAYEKADYSAALRAFEAAWAEAPNPELQFNIARCHEHMFQWDAAADAYQTYLASKPNAADAYEINSRIAELRRRAHETDHPTAAPAPDRGGMRVAAGVTLAATLALAGAGTGAYLSAWSEYDSRSSSCAGRCSPASLDGLRTRVEIAQVSGAVLFSLAGVALITDIALWVVDARARRK